MPSTISKELHQEYERLIKRVAAIPPSRRTLLVIEGTGGKVSVADIIAYQIGWGKCLIRWYEDGIRDEKPEMPGEGFLKWDYVGIAKHFYEKYRYDSSEHQLIVFQKVVSRILEIISYEQHAERLDKIGMWKWCTLASGKQWPLSKWIRVNTIAPYRRASQMIKANF